MSALGITDLSRIGVVPPLVAPKYQVKRVIVPEKKPNWRPWTANSDKRVRRPEFARGGRLPGLKLKQEPPMTATFVHDLGRNDACHCGSGRKYKHCCLDKDEAAARAERAKAEADAQAEAPAAPAAETPVQQRPPKPPSYQPWKRSATNTHSFQRMSTPRKVGGS
jgi:hypothetical protein